MKSVAVKPTPQVDALVRERVGLDVRHLERAEQSRRICAAMERAGFRDDATYATFLRASQSALLDLASELSVGETYFFRDPEQLHLLTEQVLPRLLVERPRDHQLTIWSAGCSSGEEAYTIAMLLDERGLLGRSRIVGTDLSEASVERARRGLFSSWSLRAIPKSAARRYLDRVGDKYQISDRLREHVSFERQSLTDDHAPLPGGVTRGFDLIFCKNVLIYLTDAACLQVSMRLARSLLPRGTLLTGATDNFKDLPGMWQRHTNVAGVMFQKDAPAMSHVTVDLKVAPPPSMAMDLHDEEPRALIPQRRAPTKPQPLRAADAAEGDDEIENRRRLLKEQPLSTQLHVELASLLMEAGREAEAEVALRTALYLDRELVMAHFLMALLHQRRGDHERALRAYLRVAALCSAQPDDAAVLLGDGVSHKLLGESARRNARELEHNARPA